MFFSLSYLNIHLLSNNPSKKRISKILYKRGKSFFGIKKENQYISLTLHNGRDFNLYEKSLENCLKNDDPLNKK